MPTPLSLPRPVGFALVLAAVPIFVAGAIVAFYGVDVPWNEDWELVPLLLHLEDGTLTWSELTASSGLDRPLFPRAIRLVLASATGWNIRGELALGLVLRLALFLLAWRLMERTRRSVRPFSPPSWWIAPLLALTIFALSDGAGLLEGSSLRELLGAVAILAGLGLLADAAERWPALALAAGLGTVASASTAAGLLFWPLGLGLVVRPDHRRGARSAAWIAAAIVVIGLASPPLPVAAEGGASRTAAGSLAIRAASALGAPLFSALPFGAGALAGGLATVGFFGLAVGLLCFDGHRARTARWLWMMLGAQGLLGLVIAPKPASASLFWIAWLGLLVTVPPARVRNPVALFAGGGAALLLVAGSWQSFDPLREGAALRRTVRTALIAGQAVELPPPGPEPGRLQTLMRDLDQIDAGPRRGREQGPEREPSSRP